MVGGAFSRACSFCTTTAATAGWLCHTLSARGNTNCLSGWSKYTLLITPYYLWNSARLWGVCPTEIIALELCLPSLCTEEPWKGYHKVQFQHPLFHSAHPLPFTGQVHCTQWSSHWSGSLIAHWVDAPRGWGLTTLSMYWRTPTVVNTLFCQLVAESINRL